MNGNARLPLLAAIQEPWHLRCPLMQAISRPGGQFGLLEDHWMWEQLSFPPFMIQAAAVNCFVSARLSVTATSMRDPNPLIIAIRPKTVRLELLRVFRLVRFCST